MPCENKTSHLAPVVICLPCIYLGWDPFAWGYTTVAHLAMEVAGGRQLGFPDWQRGWISQPVVSLVSLVSLGLGLNLGW